LNHNPKIVEPKQITNELVAYRVVCCGETCCLRGECREVQHVCCTPEAHTCEESWHTVSVHREDHEGYMAERMKEVADRHEKMIQWRLKKAAS